MSIMEVKLIKTIIYTRFLDSTISTIQMYLSNKIKKLKGQKSKKLTHTHTHICHNILIY